MLYAIDKSRYIEAGDIPHAADFRRWRARLTDEQFGAIAAAFEEKIDAQAPGQQILTSSWIPGNDWTGTPYDPIYQIACDQNTEESGLCFGLFLWVVLSRRPWPEVWGFGRYDKGGIPIRGLTYFVLDNPPPPP
jgi:hypothetical protein